jgi:uroporphyrinogen III methyltransferase/synthase
MGAEVLLAPMVEIRPIADTGPLDAAIQRLGEFDWLVFTSANGVRYFLRRLDELGFDLRALGGIRLAAIGPGTAEILAGYHLRADLVPESFRSEALADALAKRAEGARILLARADRGRAVLREELEHLAEVTQVAVYQNTDVPALPDAVAARIADGSVDWITLTSSAIATRLHDLLPEPARLRVRRDVRLASLSPVTSETVRGFGWDVAVEPEEYTWEGLVRSLVERVAVERGDPGVTEMA